MKKEVLNTSKNDNVILYKLTGSKVHGRHYEIVSNGKHKAYYRTVETAMKDWNLYVDWHIDLDKLVI